MYIIRILKYLTCVSDTMTDVTQSGVIIVVSTLLVVGFVPGVATAQSGVGGTTVVVPTRLYRV